jgi:hypothetical protein
MTKPTDWRKTCAELIEDVCYLIDCVDHDCCDPVALMECREHLSQTRTALSQPEPEGLTTAELDALWLATWSDETQQYDVAAFARAVIAADRARTALSQPEPEIEPAAYLHRQGNYTEASEMSLSEDEKARGWTEEPLFRRTLAQPEPEGVTDEGIPQWSEGVCGDGAAILRDGVMMPIEEVVASLNRAEILTRYASPTIEPVPVAERPWEREGWCDAEGRCWFLIKGSSLLKPCWVLGEPGEGILTHSFSLPHYALPLPTPTP